jgi:hypothetical protein
VLSHVRVGSIFGRIKPEAYSSAVIVSESEQSREIGKRLDVFGRSFALLRMTGVAGPEGRALGTFKPRLGAYLKKENAE